MKKHIKLILFISIVLSFTACDLYPDWEDYVEYSSVYPVCGEYYVIDYNANDMSDTITEAYYLYIYNKSYNPTGDSIWIDNNTGHPAGGDPYSYKYKIKCKADTENLKFDCTKQGHVSGTFAHSQDSAVTVTIESSFIIDEDPGDILSSKADSIYFKFSYYDKYGELVRTLVTAGHRKTGWEEPEYDDDM